MNNAAKESDKENWLITVVKKKVNSVDLFRSGKELSILHDGYEYKLRLTGNGKLILTK